MKQGYQSKSLLLFTLMLLLIVANTQKAEKINFSGIQKQNMLNKLKEYQLNKISAEYQARVVGAGVKETKFFPINGLKVVGMCIMFICMFCAVLAGTGGAAQFLPIFLIFYNQELELAVAHTAYLEFVSSAVRVGYELQRQYSNPTEEKRINYYAILIAACSLFIGSFLGVRLNEFAPKIVILVFSTITISFSSFMCFVKYRKIINDQKKKLELQKGNILDESVNNDSILAGIQEENDKTLTNLRESDLSFINQVQTGEKQYTLKCLIVMLIFVCFLVSPLASMLLGTRQVKSIIGIEHCSQQQFYVMIGYFVVMILLSAFNYKYVLKQSGNIIATEKYLEYTKSKVIQLYFLCMANGFITGFVATGAGSTMNLILLYLNLKPSISTPTAMVIVAMTSGSATLLFALQGKVDYWCLLINGSIIVVSGVLARSTLYKKIVNSGKETIIVLFLGIIMAIPIPINIIKEIPELKDLNAIGQLWKTGSIC